MSREAAADSSATPILTNHWAATFALMNQKEKMQRVTELSLRTYIDNPRAYIIWDPQIANSPFSQQGLTFERVIADSSVERVDSVVVNQQTMYLLLKVPPRYSR